MLDLFATGESLLPIPLPDGELFMMEQLPLQLDNDAILAQLIDETAWRADSITVLGKRFLQPRLTSWQGAADYTYSGVMMPAGPCSPLVQQIQSVVENVTGLCFNSVLLNYYRDGRDSIGMHSDDEPELGPEPAIASVSFGDTRTFVLKHKRTSQMVKLDLTAGSLLLMCGRTQANWQHGINKTTRPVGPRLNVVTCI
ncbi:alpha-ketoglutarate-dependent dioxygenase AlkB [Massilia sp. PAMC28688]|nr:alpha-ketoglutarate-dependent dioxygenase AlkB [Massilia sp. PAMC28688]